jgi:hypothetical protein
MASLKIHRLVVLAALLLAGVMALGATLVIRHRGGRVRRPVDVPEVPAPPVRPSPRPLAAAEAPWRFPAAPAPARPTDVLRVRVVGPHGLLPTSAEVTAVRQRTGGHAGNRGGAADDTISLDEDDDGVFTAESLEPGTYEILVESYGLRSARIEGVRAGDEVVDVALARAPVLLGALGNRAGSGCNGFSVGAKAPDSNPTIGDAETVDAETVDAETCTFVMDQLPERCPLTVTAKGEDLVERSLVTLPVQGDPAALCLRPPCDVQPASLAVYVADGAGRLAESVTLEWTLVGDETYGEMGTLMGVGLSYLHGRRAGQSLRIRAAVGDRAAETTALVGPGVTDVVLTVPER